MFLLEKAAFTFSSIRDKFNIAGVEMDNLELAKLIAAIMGKELKYELVDHYADRPGHDPRYMLDGTKLAQFGWKCPVDFEHSLEKTIKWSLEHPRWLDWK
jgi:dTDP-glucose 4,6-dehydratase